MKSLSKKLTLVFTMIVLIACGMLIISTETDLKYIQKKVTDIRCEDIREGYKTQVKSEVQTALTICQNYYDSYKAGKMTEDEAKAQALSVLREFRYGDDSDGYVWVDDTNYNLVMHPILPDQEGTNRKDLTDKNGVKIIQSIMKVADKGGFNEFLFTKSDGKTVAPKVAYSKSFPQWNWVITTGCYTDDINSYIAKNANTNNLDSLFSKITIMLLTECVVLVLVMMIVSAIIINKLVKVINNIKDTLQEVSEGNLTTQLAETNRKDEIGDTARHTNKAINSFREIISDSKDTSETVRDTSDSVKSMANSAREATHQIAQAIEGIATDATSQADSISEVMTKVNDMQESTAEISQSVQDIDTSAKDLGEKSEEMKKSLQDMQTGNMKMSEEVNAIDTAIKETNEIIDKMSEIVGSIKNIASETNLLALNASIEAAHAGEAGRGFAVVANSIKNLSENTSVELEKITEIIGNLVDKFNLCTTNITSVVSSNKANTTGIEEVMNSFDGLNKSIAVTSEKVISINSLIDETVENMKVINEQVVDVQNGAESSAAASEQVTASSEELAALMSSTDETISDLTNKAKTLYEKLNKFKV